MSTLEEVIAEKIRGISTYGKDQTVPARGGGTGAAVGGARNRGKPGYPVPAAMLAQTTSEPSLEEDTIAEAKAIPKSIAHLDDLEPEEFMRFLEKYRSIAIAGGLEISEKVDGSARITFGVSDGTVWVQSKNSPVRFSPIDWPDKPMFKALKAAHEALDSSEQLVSHWPEDVQFMVAEVLYTKVPNSIEYGPNAIIVHGVHSVHGKDMSDVDSRERVDKLASTIGRTLNVPGETWKFEYKRIIDPSELTVDVSKEYETLGELHTDLLKIAPSRRRTSGKEEYARVRNLFKDVQRQVKRKLIDQLRKQTSAYGPSGGEVEGVVFKDLETGVMTKLVDKEIFTQLNKFLWYYRELLDRGAKVGDSWIVGVIQKFRNMIADEVMGDPVAKTPGFVQHLKRYAKDKNSFVYADSPEKRAEVILASYVKENDLMPGNFVQRFQKALRVTRDDFEKLRAQWKSVRDKEVKRDLRDEDGNVIKTVTMHPLVKERTDEAFVDMEKTLDAIEEGLANVSSESDELTQKVMLIKLMMGRERFNKLTELEDIRESVERKTSDDYVVWNKFIQGYSRWVLEKFRKKLKKRGYEVGQYLGSGSKAGVFELPGNRVLKITLDASDARSSALAKKSPKEHVLRVIDVFRFPVTNSELTSEMKHVYGIVSEKLKPLPPDVAFVFKKYDVLKYIKRWIYDGTEWQKAIESEEGAEAVAEIPSFLRIVQAFELDELVEDMRKLGIRTDDVTVENLMLRGKTIVLADLGYSHMNRAADIRKLESIRRATGSTDFSGVKLDPELDLDEVVAETIAKLVEGRAESVGATIGRYQPFHAGHASVIRDLTTRHQKVLVFVAGQSKSQRDPFSHQLRVDMMKRSLPDVWSKIEIYPASIDGKNTGYVPGLIAAVTSRGMTSANSGSNVSIVVGQDRAVDIQKQIQHNSAHSTEPGYFQGILTLTTVPDLKSDDDAGRISGTRIRQALAKGDAESVKKMMDPHVLTDPAAFDDLYNRMRSEMGIVAESTHVPQKRSEVYATDEFVEWYKGLRHGGEEEANVDKLIEILEIYGVHVPGTYSQSIVSKYPFFEMKNTGRFPMRIIYAFNPKRQPVAIYGWNKRGVHVDAIDRNLITRVEKIWEKYLHEYRSGLHQD